MRTYRLIFFLLLAVTPIAAFAVQDPGADPGVPLIRTETNMVLVDVVVTDKGNPVHGLDKAHFRVFEDGKEQPVASFDEHKPAPPGAASAPLAAAIANLPPNTYTNVPIYPEASAINVLLLDGLNTPMVNQAEARRQMIDYMGKITPGTELAIFTLTSQLRMVAGFTTNAGQLAKVLKSKAATSQQSALINSNGESAQNDVNEVMAMITDSSSGAPNQYSAAALEQFQSDLTAQQIDLRVRFTLDAMQQLARYLSAIPGRKNLIWFSGSFPISLDPDPDQPLPFLNVQTYGDAMRRTSDLLAAARVAVYPVDARGMLGSNTVDAAYSPSATRVTVNSGGKVKSNLSSMNDSNVVHDYETFETQTMEEHGTMQQVADQTGGRAFVNTNDLSAAVASAVENGASYYTLAYSPKDKKFNGRYRKIRVSLDNGSYKLSYRNGYYGDQPGKAPIGKSGPAALITAATMHGAPAATQILFRAQIVAGDDPLLANMKMPKEPQGELATKLKGPTRRYLANLLVDAHGVHFETSPDGQRHAQLEYVLVDYDADGTRLNYVDRSFGIDVTPERYAQIMQTGMTVRLLIDVPQGPSSLRIIAQDLVSASTGALELPLSATCGGANCSLSAR